MKKLFKFVLLYTFIIALFLLLNSCGSACSRQHRYWNKHRCVEHSNPNVIKNERYGYS